MANISDAFGTVTIVADTKEDLMDLLYLQKVVDSESYYNCDIELPIKDGFHEGYDFKKSDGDYEKFMKTLNSEEIEEEEGRFKLKTSFLGNGRWAFKHNIEWFFPLVFDRKEYGFAFQKDIKHRLKPKQFVAIFDYTDHEPGCEVLYEGITKVIWNETEQKTGDIEINFLKYTAENLVELGVYDFAIDRQYVLDNFDEVCVKIETDLPEYQELVADKEQFRHIVENKVYKYAIEPTLEDWLCRAMSAIEVGEF